MARPDQTEKATPKRRRDARERGQVPRSHDLAGAAIFLVLITVLHMLLMPTVDAAAAAMHGAIDGLAHPHALSAGEVIALFARNLWSYAAVLGLMFGAAVAIALVANWLQFGFLFTFVPLQPKFGKLNPIPGLQRIFLSKQTFVNLAKQLLKMGAVAAIVASSVSGRTGDLYAVGQLDARSLIGFLDGTLFGVGIRFGLLLLVLGLVDYAWERRQFESSLKMSKQEVKDEARQAEGNPEAKGAVKNRQRAMARKRMMAAVPKATVVITNPTHFAVALAWDEAKMEAPVLVAKGADLLAKRIRDLARENGVPLMEDPPLARNLYRHVELDSPVPPELYAAVAQVIAFVYKLHAKTIA